MATADVVTTFVSDFSKPIEEAIENWDAEALKQALSNIRDIPEKNLILNKAQDKEGNTFLHQAARKDLELVNLLLDAGANPTIKNSWNYTFIDSMDRDSQREFKNSNSQNWLRFWLNKTEVSEGNMSCKPGQKHYMITVPQNREEKRPEWYERTVRISKALQQENNGVKIQSVGRNVITLKASSETIITLESYKASRVLTL